MSGHGIFLDPEIDQGIAGKIECDARAGGEGHGAAGCADGAIVAHGTTKQGDISPGRSGQRTLVNHRGVARASETAGAAGQIGVGQIESGGHQTADVDLGTRPEKHASGIEQENLAVGVEAPVNHGAVGIVNPVNRHRISPRLHEINRLVNRDVKAGPIEPDSGARLSDRGRRTGRLNRTITDDDPPADRCGHRLRDDEYG